MKTNALPTISIIIALSLCFTACGGKQGLDEGQELATAVAATMAAIPSELQTEDTPEPDMPVMAGDLQPLETDCSDLQTAMEATLGLMVSIEIVPVQMSWGGETGGACQLTGLGNGNDFENIFEPSDALKDMLVSRGWAGSMMMPCLGHGGAGPGADQSCYISENRTCEIMVTLGPIDMSLCDGVDGPIGECFAILSPEQKLFTNRLTCAQGKLSMPLPKTEPERIEFGSGAISTQVQGSLAPGGLAPYVLTAMAGQEMTVNLIASGDAVLTIWGLDGTVLISSHAGAISWAGLLPLTQDYYIDVVSQYGSMLDYTLEVTIPPAGTTTSAGVFPKIEPFPFGEMQSIVGFGVPPMLPPDFPVEAGQPAIVPYMIGGRIGEYEFSLDYGKDCQGAGACHYGVIAGMQTSAPIPVGSNTFPFEANRAEQVTLANNIVGYFVDYTCGANCNDAMVWWIYGGYQYILGLKAGPRETVIALANAAIDNSIH